MQVLSSATIKVWSSSTIKLGRKQVLTFKCHICHSTPMSHPIIFTQCCKTILGCEVCVGAWFGGEEGRSKSCPLCRAERAYSETCRLHGLDDLVSQLFDHFYLMRAVRILSPSPLLHQNIGHWSQSPQLSTVMMILSRTDLLMTTWLPESSS